MELSVQTLCADFLALVEFAKGHGSLSTKCFCSFLSSKFIYDIILRIT